MLGQSQLRNWGFNKPRTTIFLRDLKDTVFLRIRQVVHYIC